MAEALEHLFGRSSAIEADVCVACREPACEFRDPLSAREYRISGLCQACQDDVFRDEEDVEPDLGLDDPDEVPW